MVQVFSFTFMTHDPLDVPQLTTETHSRRKQTGKEAIQHSYNGLKTLPTRDRDGTQPDTTGQLGRGFTAKGRVGEVVMG